jgi:acetyl-CoA acyltransferase
MKPLAIVDGIRTPFAKAGEELSDIPADELGQMVLSEVLLRTDCDAERLDEVIMGNVAMPPDAMNIARVCALKAGIPESVPAYTVHRNCASGMESVSSALEKMNAGYGEVFLAGGTESMSNIPFFYRDEVKEAFVDYNQADGILEKTKKFLTLPWGKMLAPIIGVRQGLTDPVSELNMGETAEVLAREFDIGRQAQDEFALRSHQKAVEGRERLREEIMEVSLPGRDKLMQDDGGPREQQSMEDLGKLPAVFADEHGTVTPGNACPITDGASALLVMSPEKAEELGYDPLGYLVDYEYAGLDPARMGLGPAYSTAKLVRESDWELDDFGLIEINEAFAVQILASAELFESEEFADEMGLDEPVGELDFDILNVNGGAIALGHPVGVSGNRLILTLLKEMNRRGVDNGLATLCVGGGQGAALAFRSSL